MERPPSGSLSKDSTRQREKKEAEDASGNEGKKND